MGLGLRGEGTARARGCHEPDLRLLAAVAARDRQRRPHRSCNRRRRAAAPQFHRPAARPRADGDGARPHPRFLRRQRDESARRCRAGAVHDALDHALLRPDIRHAGRYLGLALRGAGPHHRRTLALPAVTRIVAGCDRVHGGAARLDVRVQSRLLHHAGDLRHRRLDDGAGRAGAPAALGDRDHRHRHDRGP